MILAYLAFFTAIFISIVAIYYSVAGLAAIFAAAVIPIIIMGVSLEVGKLVTAVWLHQYWKQAKWWLKTYLSISVVVLMFITSMGIFGFLSKAHIDQTATAGDNTLQIQQFDNRIEREQKRIKDAELVTSQLDKAVQVLLDADRIRGRNGAIATREAQKAERDSLNKIITEASNSISKLQDEKLVLTTQQVKLEAEVGPIKYIAEFIYGEKADKNLLEEAVRWVIIIIIFVFDPLAVLLLIASQETFRIVREGKGGGLPPKPEPDPSPEDGEITDEEYWEQLSEEALRDAYDEPSTQQEPVKQSQQSKHSSQMLMFDSVDSVPQETAIKETIPQETTDSNQMEFDFENKNLNSETEIDKWNEWVEAANRAAQENPEVDEDDDDVFADVTPEEKNAMQQWKHDTGGSLKLQRLLAKQGRIKNVPWLDYLRPQPDFVEDKKFQIMPELERLNKGKPQYTEVIDPKKKTLVNWMEKDGNQQIKKSKEMDE
jgi:hypothetical protein